MKVHLLYFGVLKDHFDGERDLVELPDHSNVAALLQLLRGNSSNESTVWKTLAVAVNREYAGQDTMLNDGDEVALLPPVSGGSDAR